MVLVVNASLAQTPFDMANSVLDDFISKEAPTYVSE